MGKFIISKKNGEFQFDFVNDSGDIVLKSGSYTRKTMCINGIESIKRNSQDNSKFKSKRSINNESYFNLKSFNGKIIGVSVMYKDKISRDLAIEFVKKNAIVACIDDQSKRILSAESYL
jgi:uncharacterized protein YegP (UPF0339 family)